MANCSFLQKYPFQEFTEAEKEIDYSEQDNHYIRCLQAMEEVMDIDAYILDYRKEQIIYMTRNCSLRKVLHGKDPGNELLSYHLFNQLIPEEDLEKIITIHYLAYSFYFDLPLERRYHSAESLDIRIRESNGSYKLVNHKVSLLDRMDDGRLRLGLCVLSYPTSKTPGRFYFKMSDTHTVYEYIERSRKFIEVKTQRLTVKSGKVLELASQGKTEKEIADILGISVNTVKYHKRTILRQLNVSNTAEAVQWMNSQKKLSEE
ncbi:MAG: helix-turn-helix transcriptional regulator [Bacteroides sp.]|nr:helix-turn-helix transcriptional regulator [Bacteroides sp.]